MLDNPNIQARAVEAGIPVRSVRRVRGQVEIVLHDGATDEDKAAARELEAACAGDLDSVEVRGRAIDLRPPLALLDALALLHVTADHPEALAVVQAHGKRVAQARAGK